MKRAFWFAIPLLFLSVLIGTQFMPGQAPPDGNLLQNAGFEDGNLTSWTPEKRAANKGAAGLGNIPVHSGQRSLKLVPNANNIPPGMAANPLGAGQAIPAGPYRGKRIYVAGWVGAEGPAVAVVGLYTLGVTGRVIPVELRQSAAGPALSFVSDSMEVPNDRKILYLIVNLHVEGTAGAAYFDDLYLGLKPPNPPEPARPRGSAESRGSMKAEITIHATQDLRRIPSTLYGTNLEWIRNGNGLFDPSSDDLSKALVGLTRDLGPTLLRFPGGIFSDFYHWKNGIGPRKSRPTSPHMPGSNETSPNNFGTDEALELSRRVGAPLMITVNVATGTPEEAVEWLQYIRSRTGGDKAPPALYWEIGNEQYVRGDAAYAKAGGMKPNEYVRRFAAFERALRAADPSIKIGAITEENYGHIAPRGYPDWTRQVLDGVAPQADFIAVHDAYAPVVADPSGKSLRDVYSAMWAAPHLIADNLRELSQKLPRQGRSPKIAVTEWGPLFNIVPNSPYVDHVKTLGSALYVASALKTFIEAKDVEAANLFKLVDPLFMGLIGLRGGQFTPTSSYYAFQLFTKHFGPVLVQSAANVPAFRSRQVGIVDSASNNPFLDVVASRSENGKKVYIILVNRSFDDSIRATIQLDGARPVGGTAWVLTGAGVDAHTGTQLPAGVNWARQATDEGNPRFEHGGPNEISFAAQRLPPLKSQFEYVVPRLSVVSLEIDSQ